MPDNETVVTDGMSQRRDKQATAHLKLPKKTLMSGMLQKHELLEEFYCMQAVIICKSKVSGFQCNGRTMTQDGYEVERLCGFPHFPIACVRG